MSPSPVECARYVLEAIPVAMRAIRTEMRTRREYELSVVQFRVLIYLHRHPGASLSAVAEHMELTLPSMSKMIDGLTIRNLVTREMDSHDRRRVTLTATELGRQVMQAAYKAIESRLAERLSGLPPPERETIMEAMRLLESIFCCRKGAPSTADSSCASIQKGTETEHHEQADAGDS